MPDCELWPSAWLGLWLTFFTMCPGAPAERGAARLCEQQRIKDARADGDQATRWAKAHSPASHHIRRERRLPDCFALPRLTENPKYRAGSDGRHW
jgi:hypothetical protein